MEKHSEQKKQQVQKAWGGKLFDVFKKEQRSLFN